MKEKNIYKKLNEDTFIGRNSEGKEKVYYKLVEFDLTETGNHYLIYTDNERAEDGKTKIFAAIVTQEEGMLYFKNIESDREWAYIGTVINMIRQQM